MKKEQSRSMATELKWIALASAISIAIIVAIPSPTAFMVIAAVFVVIGFMVPMSKAGNRVGRSSAAMVAIHCYCLNCGTEHNDVACPDCGSKARKASFSDSYREGEVAS